MLRGIQSARGQRESGSGPWSLFCSGQLSRQLEKVIAPLALSNLELSSVMIYFQTLERAFIDEITGIEVKKSSLSYPALSCKIRLNLTDNSPLKTYR